MGVLTTVLLAVGLPWASAEAHYPRLLSPAASAVLDNGRTGPFDAVAWSFTWTPCPGASEYWLLALCEGAANPAVSQRLAGTGFDEPPDHVAWHWARLRE